jgi:hypothetical protein
MKQAQLFLRLSLLLLALSFCALIASLTVQWSWIVTLLLWNHVAVLIASVVAVHNLMWGRHHWSAAARWAAAQRSFLLWLIALGVAVAIAAPLWSPAKFDMGKTETGEVVTSKHFYPKEGRYFLALNNGPAKEISKLEYDELVRDAYEFFARLWVVFSCINVCLWGYILRAESERQNAR